MSGTTKSADSSLSATSSATSANATAKPTGTQKGEAFSGTRINVGIIIAGLALVFTL